MPLRLTLISPYRMPAQHALMLGEDDTAAWLLAFRLLWNPTLLNTAQALPTIADPADHSQPQSNSLYAVPTTPTPYLPENWDELVKQAGSTIVRTAATWDETIRRLQVVSHTIMEDENQSRPFYALGFGRLVVDTLFEAMDHQRVLDDKAFTQEILSAAAGMDREANLKAAAERLMAARDSVYPVNIHLIDLMFLGDTMLPNADQRPCTLIATGEQLAKAEPNVRDEIRRGMTDGSIELAGGIDHDRPDAVLPLESQLWNLKRGQQRTMDQLGSPATVYGRATTAFHPYVPNWISQANLTKAIYVSFDGGIVPHHSAAAIRWPAPDGRRVDALTRAPYSASDPQTYFHLAHYLHQTIMQDTTAVLVLRHGDRPAGPWYDDWLTLSKLASVLGTWTTVGRFLDEGGIDQYAVAAAADEFAPEELESAVSAGQADPCSRFARHARLRRRLDATSTYHALLQSLGIPIESKDITKVDSVEDEMERNIGVEPNDLSAVEESAAKSLAARLVARSASTSAGSLVLNPCAFTRRVGLEAQMPDGLPPTGGPVKATQRDGDTVRFVVEVPGLGYAWVPNQPAEPAQAKLTLATATTIRNEFFEAEIDPSTGGLRSFRDTRDRINRLGQQLVWQPGSNCVADEVRVTACGPALGEITTSGKVVDAYGEALAHFSQRYRAWLGRPLLEMLIEIRPIKPPVGYAWHAYFAARFAWSDDRAVLHRGVFGNSTATTHHRPGSGDFLEWKSGRSNTIIVTGGLPYAQRHGSRMLDVILVAPGETKTSYELFLGCDRPQPALAAQGVISPVAVVRLKRGPPPAGPQGWLAHLDVNNVIMTALRPGVDGQSVLARLFEMGGIGGPVNLRFAREPAFANVVDGDGSLVMNGFVEGDTVTCDVMAHDLINLMVSWKQ